MDWQVATLWSKKMVLPTLQRIEERFSLESSMTWIENNWTVALYASAIYVVLVFAGRKWMQDRPAYKLRRPLVMWNTGLAIFSILGFYNGFLFPVVQSLREGGVAQSVCNSHVYAKPSTSLWVFLFLYSKIIELGDTAFIVLRKTPLSFLHWYHHISVLSYTWYTIPARSSISQWFGMMNFFVHALMYSYYTLKAQGYRIPGQIAQCITLLQLLQFFAGLYLTIYAGYLKTSGFECLLSDRTFYLGLVMYGSYLILFLNFFYHRYLAKKVKSG